MQQLLSRLLSEQMMLLQTPLYPHPPISYSTCGHEHPLCCDHTTQQAQRTTQKPLHSSPQEEVEVIGPWECNVRFFFLSQSHLPQKESRRSWIKLPGVVWRERWRSMNLINISGPLECCYQPEARGLYAF